MAIQLHLACGRRFIPGFIHIDTRKFPHINYVTDVSKLNMFLDNTVDLIYASHILEHFEKYKIDKVLKEWYRVLKIGGILRLAVPDFEKLIEIYKKYGDIELIMGPLHGGQTYKENFHYISFDLKYLRTKLESIGFKNVHRYRWQDTIHKDYDDFSRSYIPHMDFENGTLISLNVEATK